MVSPIRAGDILLGKFRVERLLGQGGMGVVVAARHIQLDELYAIKFLLPGALSNDDAVQRFLREARAAARLKGEHVARVHDFGTLDDGAPYMVMEHLVGGDLKAILKARGPLSVDEITVLMLQVCEALAEAHALGIIHRDLKPANLFFTRRADGAPCIKVLDFGISKQTMETSDLTKSGQVFGSPAYMSPEQMVGMKGVDTRSDIWSMGVILYELATGETPFYAETVVQIIGRVMQEEPAPPSSLRPDLPPWFDAVVGICLQKAAECRFQRVEDLAAALRDGGACVRSPVSAAGTPSPEGETTTVPLRGWPARSSQWTAPYSAPRFMLEPAPRAAQEPTPLSITQSSWGQTGILRRAPHLAAKAMIGLGAAVLFAWVVWLSWRREPAADSEGSSPPGVAHAAHNALEAGPDAQAKPPSSSIATPAPPDGVDAGAPVSESLNSRGAASASGKAAEGRPRSANTAEGATRGGGSGETKRPPAATSAPPKPTPTTKPRFW